MSAPGFVEALWVGSFEAELVSGKRLVPGETLHDVPEGEALASDNWKFPVPKPAPPKPKENTD